MTETSHIFHLSSLIYSHINIITTRCVREAKVSSLLRTFYHNKFKYEFSIQQHGKTKVVVYCSFASLALATTARPAVYSQFAQPNPSFSYDH